MSNVSESITMISDSTNGREDCSINKAEINHQMSNVLKSLTIIRNLTNGREDSVLKTASVVHIIIQMSACDSTSQVFVGSELHDHF